MPKYIPNEIILEAMELYLAGNKSAREIATIVSKNGVSVKPPTIYAWAKKEAWNQQKAVAVTDQQQKIAETEGQKFARLQQEHLTDYEKLRKKASAELDGNLFDRPFEAARALDLGIKGERSVMEGMINLQFVQDIMSVLVEEISDADTLQRIAFKLKTLIQVQESND